MNKAELIATVAEKSGLSKKDSELAVNAVFESIAESLKAGDPNYTTCLLANLGSIKADSCYHHLSNSGTNSLMVTIGTIRHDDETGRDTLDVTATLDERIADGFYFAKSLRLVRYLFDNPEKLMEKISEEIPQELFN